MSRGESGRVVIEVDPTLTRQFYSALAARNSTMKEWFIEAAKLYISEHEQPPLPEILNKKDRGKQS
jgi:hypothetical protein